MSIKSSNLLQLILLAVLAFFCCSQSFADTGNVEALLKMGNDYTNLFQYDKAFENYKKATELSSGNWEAWFNGGKALIKLKRIDEAESYLVKAIELNPNELDIQKALGAIYIQNAKNAQANGQTAKKLEYQLKACHAYPAATKIWLALFEQWWDANELSKIRAEGDFIVKRNQQLLDQAEDASLQSAIVLVAKAYFAEGDYTKADSFLTAATKIRVSNDELYALRREIRNKEDEKVNDLISIAQNEIYRKQYDKALETLKSVSSRSGGRSSEVTEKIEKLERQISISKCLEESEKLINAQNYEAAYEKLEEGIQNFPDNDKISAKQAEVSKKLEEIREAKIKEEEAKNQAEHQKQMKKMRFSAFLKEAKTYEDQKNYDAAVELLEKALNLDPEHEETKNKIALLREKSRQAKERSKRYESLFDELQNNLKNGNFEKCLEDGKTMLREYEENKLDISVCVIEACIKLEKFDEASKTADNIINNKQYEDLYNYAKGMAAYKKGVNEEAKTFLTKVKEGNSQYKAKAKKIIFYMFMQKGQYVVYAVIIFTIILLYPKVKDLMKERRERSRLQKLEKIKETGSYEANFDFLKARYENEDVSNGKLVMLLYAAALQKKGDYPKAYELITEYLKRDSRSPLAKSIAGEVALALGETSPIGLEHIQGLLKLNESRADVISYLAKTYISQKTDHKMAQEMIAKYISLNPSDSEATIYLADVYISRQAYNANSIKTFEKAIKAKPEVSDYFVALMENHKVLGNSEEAEKILAVIKERFPDYANSSPQQDYGQQFYGQQDYRFPTYPQQQDYVQQQYPQQQDYYTQQYEQNQDQSSRGGVTTEPEKSHQPTQQYAFPENNSSRDQTAKSGIFPDYDSIGIENTATGQDPFQYTQNVGNSGLPDLSDLIQPPKDIPSGQSQVQSNTQRTIMGPKKNCPHCGAVNPASEYYCNSCGKPF